MTENFDLNNYKNLKFILKKGISTIIFNRFDDIVQETFFIEKN